MCWGMDSCADAGRDQSGAEDKQDVDAAPFHREPEFAVTAHRTAPEQRYENREHKKTRLSDARTRRVLRLFVRAGRKMLSDHVCVITPTPSCNLSFLILLACLRHCASVKQRQRGLLIVLSTTAMLVATTALAMFISGRDGSDAARQCKCSTCAAHVSTERMIWTLGVVRGLFRFLRELQGYMPKLMQTPQCRST